jgi:hypothetical protein
VILVGSRVKPVPVEATPSSLNLDAGPGVRKKRIDSRRIEATVLEKGPGLPSESAVGGR